MQLKDFQIVEAIIASIQERDIETEKFCFILNNKLSEFGLTAFIEAAGKHDRHFEILILNPFYEITAVLLPEFYNDRDINQGFSWKAVKLEDSVEYKNKVISIVSKSQSIDNNS